MDGAGELTCPSPGGGCVNLPRCLSAVPSSESGLAGTSRSVFLDWWGSRPVAGASYHGAACGMWLLARSTKNDPEVFGLPEVSFCGAVVGVTGGLCRAKGLLARQGKELVEAQLSNHRPNAEE